jgi:hypothetical protein
VLTVLDSWKDEANHPRQGCPQPPQEPWQPFVVPARADLSPVEELLLSAMKGVILCRRVLKPSQYAQAMGSSALLMERILSKG